MHDNPTAFGERKDECQSIIVSCWNLENRFAASCDCRTIDVFEIGERDWYCSKSLLPVDENQRLGCEQVIGSARLTRRTVSTAGAPLQARVQG